MSLMAFLALAAALNGPSPSSSSVQPSVAIQVPSQPEGKRTADGQQRLDTALSIVPPVRKNPYAGLFPVARATARQRPTDPSAAARTPASTPRVVCGMTMWQVDPELDARIRIAAPSHGVESRIQRIEPPSCRER